MMGSKVLDYISAIGDQKAVDELSRRMMDYYSINHQYYEDIEFAVGGWGQEEHLLFRDIAERCRDGEICEIGCGAAGILRAMKMEPSRYHGCDFSKELLARNQSSFPDADFKQILDPRKIPFESEQFDVVFSVCVLEHVVTPHTFLEELLRVAKPGGTVLVLCPDFFSRLGITSQVMGSSGLSGRQKLARGQFLDAIKTLWISRVALPRYLKSKLQNADKQPVFLLNNNPSCFHHRFYPDSDAVYVTHRGEIDTTICRLGADVLDIDSSVAEYALSHRMIYAGYRKTEVLSKGSLPLSTRCE